ncbi:MAG: hypothetical protein K2W94_05060 [Alphaproteobacteria bacterium]|nr:hypothetical protein [Alphaproteobacteria bacterium]
MKKIKLIKAMTSFLTLILLPTYINACCCLKKGIQNLSDDGEVTTVHKPLILVASSKESSFVNPSLEEESLATEPPLLPKITCDVLVVDDETPNRRILERQATRLRYTVHLLNSGVEAIDFLIKATQRHT